MQKFKYIHENSQMTLKQCAAKFIVSIIAIFFD